MKTEYPVGYDPKGRTNKERQGYDKIGKGGTLRTRDYCRWLRDAGYVMRERDEEFLAQVDAEHVWCPACGRKGRKWLKLVQERDTENPGEGNVVSHRECGCSHKWHWERFKAFKRHY